MSNAQADNSSDSPRLWAYLVEFDSPGALLTAAERVRDAGYRRWDTYSPYPVHGIDQAMGVQPTRLPWLVFVLGVTGCIGGLLLQWWTNATGAPAFSFVPNFLLGYDFVVSGKPAFSLPANIPIIFETTVLLAALGAVFGMLAMNNLPLHHKPLLANARFKRVTADRFFIAIDATDPRFDQAQTRGFLAELGGSDVERIEELPGPTHTPSALTIITVILVCLALLPPLFVAKARLSKSRVPRIHPIQDMDNQPRFKAQMSFAPAPDGRAGNLVIPGRVARGDLEEDTRFYTGRDGEDWVTTYPSQVEVTAPFIERGRERFDVYCAPCHGLGGAGDGIVAQRAVELETVGWIAPTSLVSDVVVDRELGHLYNTIHNGIRSMPPYGDQIPPRDRWAIVTYVRALQRSQHANVEDVPPEVRPELR